MGAQYVVIYNQKTGKYQIMAVPQGGEWDPVGALVGGGFLEGDRSDYSVQNMEGQRPGELLSAENVGDAAAWVESKNAPIVQQEQATQRQGDIKTNEARTRQTQVNAAPRGPLQQQAAGAPSEQMQRPMGGNLIAGLDPMGAPLTNSQIIGANQKTRQAAIDAGMPTTDQFDRQITDPTVTMMGLPQMNQANKYTPGVNTNPAQSRPLNDGSNGLGGPSYNPSNPTAGTQAGDQPYSFNDDVALQTLLNNGAGNDMLAENYIRQGGYGNSVHSDFARKNFEVYDDLYAMQNPGAPILGANDMYGKQTQYMQEMSQPVGDGVGMLNGGELWDNQFSQEYMGSERAQGSGEDFQSRSQSQYDQIMTNVVALQPSMGPSGISAIMNMVDQGYEDYKYLSMSGDPTVQNMSFVQYLESIGASDWF